MSLVQHGPQENVKRGYPDFLSSLHSLLPGLAPQRPHKHPQYSHNLTEQACDSPYPSAPSILVLCGLCPSVWVSNILRALFRRKYRINSSDQTGTLQRSGGTKVTVVEGHRKRRVLLVSEFASEFVRGKIDFEMKFQSIKSLEGLLITDYFPFDVSRLIKPLKSTVKGKVKPTLSSKHGKYVMGTFLSLFNYNLGFLSRVMMCRLLFQEMQQALAGARAGQVSQCFAR